MDQFSLLPFLTLSLHRGVNPRRQDSHALPILWPAIGFDQDKAPAPFDVDMGYLGGRGIQVELAGEIDLNDAGQAIGFRHVSITVGRFDLYHAPVGLPHLDLLPAGRGIDLHFEKQYAAFSFLGYAECGATGRRCGDGHSLVLGHRRRNAESGSELSIRRLVVGTLVGTAAAGKYPNHHQRCEKNSAMGHGEPSCLGSPDFSAQITYWNK